jgi:hypothetical protein
VLRGDHVWLSVLIWNRKHLFTDLRPYTCFFANCAFVDNPFSNRQLWVGHLEIEHGFGPAWEGIECPLCLEHTGNGKGLVLTHFARHMEDIALAALPRGVDSDVESNSESSSLSDSIRGLETTVDENTRGIGGWLESSPAPDYDPQLEVISREDELMASMANGQQPEAGQRGPVLYQPQRVAAAQNFLRQNPGIIQSTDNEPFPPGVLNAQIQQRLPPSVKSWQQLKQWARQNPNMLPGVHTTAKILLLQVMHFQDMIRHGIRMLGIHPQAQITPSQDSVQTQTLQLSEGPKTDTNPIQVTVEEIQIFRERLQGHQQANVSDDQLRQHILTQKMKVREQQQQYQQAQERAQQQAQQHAQPTLPVRDIESSQTIPEDQNLTATELWTERDRQAPESYEDKDGPSELEAPHWESGIRRRPLFNTRKCATCWEHKQDVIGSQTLSYRQLLIVIVPPIQSQMARQVRQMQRAWNILLTRLQGCSEIRSPKRTVRRSFVPRS